MIKFHNLELCGIRINVYNGGVFLSPRRELHSLCRIVKQIVSQIVLIISSFKQFFEQSLVQTIVPFALDTVFIENSSRFRLTRSSEFNLNKKVRDKQ